MTITFEQYIEQHRIAHAQQQPIFSTRPITGKRFSVLREGLKPIDLIIYRPTQVAKTPFPVLFNMHGGGFTSGDAVLMDSFCRMLADELSILVVNINYQKAPEYSFPYAITEVTDTAEYFANHADEYNIDPLRMVVCGQSAGASLAAGAALKVRDEGRIQFICQLLIYPCTDLGSKPPLNDTSEEANQMRMFIQAYCRNGEERHLWASPLLAKDADVAKICPAIFITCEFDDLCEQGEAYAQKLIRCGVPVTIQRFVGAMHGFLEVNRPDYFHNDDRKTSEQAILCQQAEAFIRKALQLYIF